MTVLVVRRRALAALMAVSLAMPFATLQGQQPVMRDTAHVLSLEDALRLAGARSEAMRVAEAGVSRARGEQLRARSQLLPQLNASAGYIRTLRSQFQDIELPPPNPDALDPIPDPARPDLPANCFNYLNRGGTIDQRITGLEDAARCSGDPFGIFARLPFGQKNAYSLGLGFSQNLFAGGRLVAQQRAASAGRRAADIEITAQRAQLALDVTEAYYDAVLGDRLLAIAESSLVQTDDALRHAQLAKNVGNTSEFELLRAQVTRDNQRPVAIQRRAERDIAYLRLKQLLELPLSDSLELTSQIQDDAPPSPALLRLTSSSGGMTADTSADARAGVRQAVEAARAQQELLLVARSQRIPSLALTSQYGRFAYPSAGFPNWRDFRQDWTVGVQMRVPLFAGGRIRGDEMVAQANVTEARARTDQARELAALDAQLALATLRQAEASWAASTGTSGQATRAYSIAEIRYREGISTQLELTESRILLQQALANRAMAARNLQVARIRLALLRDLPLLLPQRGGMRVAQPQSPSQLPSTAQPPSPPPSGGATSNTQFGNATP